MLNSEIANIRQAYTKASLDVNDLFDNPLKQFKHWFNQAVESNVEEVNAMTLATVDSEGMADARIVLLKSISPNGFIFFTNYNSAKGKQLNNNKNACIVFFWKELERQVRIKGTVEKISGAASDEYFYSRPLKSQLGALASDQSQVIDNRESLEQKYNQYKEHTSADIKRPEHWGGYIVKPSSLEFWQGRDSRLHDRMQYKILDGNWSIKRLQP